MIGCNGQQERFFLWAHSIKKCFNTFIRDILITLLKENLQYFKALSTPSLNRSIKRFQYIICTLRQCVNLLCVALFLNVPCS